MLLGALLDWFGWLASLTEPPFHGFRVSVLFLELAAVVAALVAMRIFEFPLLVPVVAVGALFWLIALALASRRRKAFRARTSSSAALDFSA